MLCFALECVLLYGASLISGPNSLSGLSQCERCATDRECWLDIGMGLDSIHDKSKFSPIQTNQNFKTPRTGLQRGSMVCRMGTGVSELAAKLDQGLRSTLGASQSTWHHFALWGSA